jgi:hypothetical protein
MKKPKYPNKPYPPYRPSPPPKTVDVETDIGSLDIDTYSDYSIDTLFAVINNHTTNADLKDVRLRFQINKTFDYDDCTYTLEVKLFTTTKVPNPQLAAQTKSYEAELERYKKEREKYNKALKQYNQDMLTYEAELPLWQLEAAKATVKRLEKKTKKP